MVVGGAVDSKGGGSDVVAVGSVGSVVTLGAGVVSTTRGAAGRRVRAGVRGRGVGVGVAVGVSVRSEVGSAGLVSAGTSGAGRLIALFVVRGAGQRNNVAITATAAAVPPMVTSAVGLRAARRAGVGARSASSSSASSRSGTAAHRPLPLRCVGSASFSPASVTRAVAWPVVASPDGGVYPESRPAVFVAPRVPVNPPSAGDQGVLRLVGRRGPAGAVRTGTVDRIPLGAIALGLIPLGMIHRRVRPGRGGRPTPGAVAARRRHLGRPRQPVVVRVAHGRR